MRRVGFAVGRTVFQVGRRHQILQHNLLPLRNLVELIEVDKCKRGESEVQVGFVFEVDAVVVVFSQLARQQDAAEARLAAPLPAYEQRHQRIARELSLTHPHGHHRAHPQMEQLRPLVVVAAHTPCQRLHSVGAVPLRQVVQIVVHWVVRLDVV